MTEAPACHVPPPPVLSEPGVSRLLDLLPEARIVGGAVRDMLKGQTFHDLDLASPLAPDAVSARLTAAGIKVVPTGIAHGTVTAVVDGRPIEITTLRRDLETDGRHAVVAFTDSWRADAARRDFTINAMSMTPSGAVFDYFGGLADLRDGRLRFVGDPAARVAEDWLRVVRFFRFFARYATTPPDPETERALRESAPHLSSLSTDRVWSELRRILSAPDPTGALALMARLDITPALMPEGTDLAALRRLVRRGGPVDPVLRLAAWLTGDPLALAMRLKLSVADRDRLIAARSGPVPRADANDAALRRLLADEPAAILIDRCWLDDADLTDVRRRLGVMPRPVFPLEGRDLLALGLTPGPEVGALLRHVRAWWLSDGCVASKEACLAFARQHRVAQETDRDKGGKSR
jgi:poly(A) polymerase/tRNA nucleotidyltransferase (CCA-adding enzyme)